MTSISSSSNPTARWRSTSRATPTAWRRRSPISRRQWRRRAGGWCPAASSRLPSAAAPGSPTARSTAASSSIPCSRASSPTAGARPFRATCAPRAIAASRSCRGSSRPSPSMASGASSAASTPPISAMTGRPSAGSTFPTNTRCAASTRPKGRPGTRRSSPRSCWCRATRPSRRCRPMSPIGTRRRSIAASRRRNGTASTPRPTGRISRRLISPASPMICARSAAWLARQHGDALVIILGDHQPPSFIAGEKQPWTVPIHVLSRDPDLLRPFRALGYVDGALPPAGRRLSGNGKFSRRFYRRLRACAGGGRA